MKILKVAFKNPGLFLFHRYTLTGDSTALFAYERTPKCAYLLFALNHASSEEYDNSSKASSTTTITICNY